VRAALDAMKEVGTVWAAELRRSARSARVVSLLGLYGMFTALALLVVGWLSSSVQSQIDTKLAETGASAEAVQPELDKLKTGFLGALFSEDQALLESLTQVPLMVLIVFKLTLLFLPLYVAVMGFDQISGELGPRSIRYLTLRARRSSILSGKFLSQAALLIGLVLVVDLGIFVVARWLHPDFKTGVMIASLLKCWIAAVVFSAAYLALTTFCSSLFRTPALSLVFNLFLLFAFWLINAVGNWGVQWTKALERTGETSTAATVMSWLRYLTPSHYATNLLHPKLAEFGLSAVMYAAFAAVFLAGSWAVLRRRDL
jgi:ABC-type transport system involved in multi-copper enzyme maturation permease subunit